MGYEYNFPRTKFVPVDKPSRFKQGAKIRSESGEVCEALGKTDDEYIEELLDCIHACETALRQFDQSDVNRGVNRVILKNTERGYYEQEIEYAQFMTITSILPPIQVSLAYSEEEYRSQIETFDENIVIGELPGTYGVATSFKDKNDIFTGAILLRKGDSCREQNIGTLVHEVSHVVDEYFKSIDEDSPGCEIKAYVTQAIAQAVIEEFLVHEGVSAK